MHSEQYFALHVNASQCARGEKVGESVFMRESMCVCARVACSYMCVRVWCAVGMCVCVMHAQMLSSHYNNTHTVGRIQEHRCTKTGKSSHLVYQKVLWEWEV